MPTLTSAIVTAYCACTLCCGPGAPRKAAANVWPVAGVTVAGPRSLPLGTVVEIQLDGRWHRYTVQDRTAKRFDGRFDVFYGYRPEDHARALEFGKRTAKVRVLGVPSKKKIRKSP